MKLLLSGLYLEITTRCNRSCPYCYNDSKIKGTFLDKETIFKIIDECAVNNIKHISISGGEPFLHPDIYTILSYINDRDIKVRIITNLSYLNHEKAVELLQNGNSLQLTIDSINETKNDFTRGAGSFELVRNMLILSNKFNLQSNIVLRMNIGKSNANEINAYIEFAKSHKITQVAALFLAKAGRGEQYADSYNYNESILEIAKMIDMFEQIKEETKHDIDFTYSNLDEQRGCAIFGKGDIKSVPRIDPYGNVYFCSYFIGEENSFGNVKDHLIQKILNSKQAMQFIERVRNRKNNNICNKCPFTDFCMCGCPAVSYMHTENLQEKDDQCSMIKFFLKKQIVKTK